MASTSDPRVLEVLDMIRGDVHLAGYYPAGAVLDSFAVLHDYVDANDYLLALFGEHEEIDDDVWNEVAAGVDAALAASPIHV